MRYVVAIIGTLVSIGLVCVSILMNFRFGQLLGRTEFDGLIYGAASVCVDGFKIILPFAIAWAWRNSRPMVTIAGLCLFLTFTAYSFTSSIGFSAANRAETSGKRAEAARSFADLQARYERKLAEQRAVPTHRPVATLKGLLRSQEQQRRWTTTKQCTDATAGKSRAFCDAYYKLQAELGAAQTGQRISADITVLQTRIDAASASTPTQANADPQVRMLDRLSGFGESRVEMALVLVLAIMVELGSGLGLFVTFGHGEKRAPRNAPARTIKPSHPTEPAEVPTLTVVSRRLPTDHDWAKERLILDVYARAKATDVYRDYETWCTQNGRNDPMLSAPFGRWLVSEGINNREKIGGRIYYLGVRLKANNEFLLTDQTQAKAS